MSDQVPIINRVAAVVEPKEAFFAWARALDDDELAIDSFSPTSLTSVYLLEEAEQSEKSLQRHWDWIFEKKLYSWHRDREDWPQKRTYRIFREWFDVRLVELVFDFSDEPLLHDEC